MEEERKREIPREEIAAEPSQKRAKYEQLASSTMEEDEDPSFPPVEARGLTGDTFSLEGCRTVGNVMTKLAMSRNIFADRVVVMDPDGRKMDAVDHAAPSVQFVIVNEEDVVVDIASTSRNLLLHAQHGDRIACSRLAAVLETLGRRNDSETESDSDGPDFGDPITAESILSEVVLRRDPGWRTSVDTLRDAGVPTGDALIIAALGGFLEGVRYLLSTQPDLIEFEDGDGATALMVAAELGREDILAKLLASGANVDHVDSNGDTPLIVAAASYYCQRDVVVKLVAAGANVERASAFGDTALMKASGNGHIEAVGELLTAGANVNRANSVGNTALTFAAYGQMSHLLQIGDYQQHPNVERNNEDIVVKLLAAGAEVEHANSHGYTALVIFAGLGRAGELGKLLEAGAKVDYATPYGCTGFMYAAAAGHNDAVAKLLRAWANVEHANSVGDTALIRAAYNAEGADMVGILLAAGASANHANSNGISALIAAAEGGHADSVAKLLAARANANHTNSRGYTALAAATSTDCADVVAKLLAAGAEIEQGN